jgi:hypothetical protein
VHHLVINIQFSEYSHQADYDLPIYLEVSQQATALSHTDSGAGGPRALFHISPLLFLTLCCMAQWTATAETTWLRTAQSFTESTASKL